MSFTYTRDIPDGPNNPSNDQPIMKINTNSIDDIVAVDHFSFNVTGGGKHKQITFFTENVPLAPTDPTSIAYTNVGTASTKAQMFFRNSEAIFPLNTLRAYGAYPGATVNGALVALNAFNVTSVTRTSAGTYAVVLPANLITGTSYGIIATCTNDIGTPSLADFPIYQITSATSFTLKFFRAAAVLSDPTQFTFLVYQV